MIHQINSLVIFLYPIMNHHHLLTFIYVYEGLIFLLTFSRIILVKRISLLIRLMWVLDLKVSCHLYELFTEDFEAGFGDSGIMTRFIKMCYAGFLISCFVILLILIISSISSIIQVLFLFIMSLFALL